MTQGCTAGSDLEGLAAQRSALWSPRWGDPSDVTFPFHRLSGWVQPAGECLFCAFIKGRPSERGVGSSRPVLPGAGQCGCRTGVGQPPLWERLRWNEVRQGQAPEICGVLLGTTHTGELCAFEVLTVCLGNSLVSSLKGNIFWNLVWMIPQGQAAFRGQPWL